MTEIPPSLQSYLVDKRAELEEVKKSPYGEGRILPLFRRKLRRLSKANRVNLDGIIYQTSHLLFAEGPTLLSEEAKDKIYALVGEVTIFQRDIRSGGI